MVQPTVRSDTRRTRKRRIQLLDAALETFVERGYSDVGGAEIVARIGCSHGTFYNYFDNKRDALDALLSRELAEMVAVAELHRPRPRTREEFVTGLGELVGRLLEYAPIQERRIPPPDIHDPGRRHPNVELCGARCTAWRFTQNDVTALATYTGATTIQGVPIRLAPLMDV